MSVRAITIEQDGVALRYELDESAPGSRWKLSVTIEGRKIEPEIVYDARDVLYQASLTVHGGRGR